VCAAENLSYQSPMVNPQLLLIALCCLYTLSFDTFGSLVAIPLSPLLLCVSVPQHRAVFGVETNCRWLLNVFKVCATLPIHDTGTVEESQSFESWFFGRKISQELEQRSFLDTQTTRLRFENSAVTAQACSSAWLDKGCINSSLNARTTNTSRPSVSATDQSSCGL